MVYARLQMEYSYEPLDNATFQTRIVVLEPSLEFDATLCCRIQTILLENSSHETSYEALSWTWGEMKDEHMISANGKQLRVPKSLHVALQFLRKRKASRALWIDAICIDQSNVNERNHQAAQMSKIYATAAQVIVWLGEPDEETSETLNALQEIVSLERAEACEKGGSCPINLENSRGNDIVLQQRRDDSGYYRGKWAPIVPGLLKFFEKRWWSRMWVVQEVVVAKRYPKILCGYMEVSWHFIARAIGLLAMVRISWDWKELGDWSIEKANALYYFNGLRHDTGVEASMSNPNPVVLNFEHLIMATRGRDATDERDQIYAILGLIDDPENPIMEPNYNATFDQVYQQATIKILNEGGNLNFLDNARRPQRHGLPSWCIDFSQKRWDFGTTQTEAWVNKASGNISMSPLTHQPELGILTVTGTRIGPVQEYLNIARYEPENLHSFNSTEREKWFKDMVRAQAPKEQVEALMAKYGHQLGRKKRLLMQSLIFIFAAKTIQAMRLSDEDTSEKIAGLMTWERRCRGLSFSQYAEDFSRTPPVQGHSHYVRLSVEKFVQSKMKDYMIDWEPIWTGIKVGWEQYVLDLTNIERLHEIIFGVVWIIATHTENCAVLTTSTGFMAEANYYVERGDILCMLFGFGMLAILRPCPDGTCSLISTANVYHVMRGELAAQPELLTREEFRLR